MDTRAHHQLFLYQKTRLDADGKRCGLATNRNILIAQKWGDSVFPVLKSICCHLMRLSWSAAGVWCGQRIGRTAASRSSSNVCHIFWPQHRNYTINDGVGITFVKRMSAVLGNRSYNSLRVQSLIFGNLLQLCYL